MQCIESSLGFSPGCAFPYDGNSPSSGQQLLGCKGIALLIPTQLFNPKLAITCGEAEESTLLMGMPEATVNQNYGLVLPDDKVGATWQTRRMQAEPDAPAE